MDEAVPSLWAVLAQVPDPRAARGRRHPWTAVLMLIVVALLSGATSQRALARWGQYAGWARLRRLGFVRRGGPSGATVNRLLQTGGGRRLGGGPECLAAAGAGGLAPQYRALAGRHRH